MPHLLLPPFVWLYCVAGMLLVHTLLPVAHWLPAPWRLPGLLLLRAGLAMAQWHARLFRRLGTNINTFGTPDQLTTQGLFRRTRNPMYLGMLLALCGVALTLGALSPLLGPLVFLLLAQHWYIPAEERAMSARFGEAYHDYQRRVPRWW